MMTGTTISQLEQALDFYESKLSNGESIKLELVSNYMPNQTELDEFYGTLLGSGFHVSKPESHMDSNFAVTSLEMTKGSPIFLAIIPLLSTLIIGGFVVFGITKIDKIKNALMPILLVVAGITIAGIAAISTSPSAARVAEAAIRR